MDDHLHKLFVKYQQNPSFINRAPISSVHDVGSMGETLLNLAVSSQVKSDVALLLDHGANVNAFGEMRFTAIQNACITGNIGIIKLLLERGATVTAKNEFGYDANHYATEQFHDKKKSREILSLLKSYS